MALHEGEMIGPYRIIEQLGSGGMATVYKAYHPKLDRYVAIKMMHQAFLEDETFHARFEREARIVARLEHPSIVPVFDFSEHQNQPYLVMKYIEGSTLKAVLSERGALPLTEILPMMTAVADALSYAHEQGVLHRDIKPSNIIIDDKGTPYLTDFGLARLAKAGESTMSHDMLLGTPHYISPEQARGGIEIDARADIYSLGVVLYELVVGRVPFSAVTPYAIVHDHIYTPLPLPSKANPEIPPQVELVLLKALAKNPADRYGSAREMMSAFRVALEESGLKELNPERASLAAESLAKMRQEANTPPVDAISRSAITAPIAEPLPPPGSPPGGIPPAPFPGVPRPPRPPRPPRMPGSPPDPSRDPSGFAQWQVENVREKVTNALEKAFGAERVERYTGVIDKIESKLLEKIEEEIDKGTVSINSDGNLLGKDGRILIKAKNDGEAAQAWDFKTVKDAITLEDDEPLTEDAIRRRVEQGFKKRTEFYTHLSIFVITNIILWVVWASGLNFGWALPWPVIVLLSWGSGLVADGIETLYATGRRADMRERTIEREMALLYGDDWGQIATDNEYKQVRKRISKDFHHRAEFFQHIAIFLLINPLFWILWATGLTLGLGFPWPIIASLGWAIGLVSQGIETYSKSGARAREREQAIQREIERERRRLAGETSYIEGRAKRKNDDDRALRLTEEGELTDSFAEEWDQDKKRKRR